MMTVQILANWLQTLQLIEYCWYTIMPNKCTEISFWSPVICPVSFFKMSCKMFCIFSVSAGITGSTSPDPVSNSMLLKGWKKRSGGRDRGGCLLKWMFAVGPHRHRGSTGPAEPLLRTTATTNMAAANFVVITNGEGCGLTGTADIDQ